MGAAWATPPGVTEKDGGFIAPDGKPLYTFARNTDAGQIVVQWRVRYGMAAARRRRRRQG